MYDDFKVTNYPRSVVSPELYARHLARLFTGDVIDGFTVSPGTGLQVVLAPGNALIRYGSSAVASAREVSLVNNFNLAIGTPDASNPRIDLVVVYVDNSVSLPSGTPSAANLDGKGVAKAKIVPGTPAATPAAPNATAIQASVGAGNPYTVVAQVRVDNGVSVIASGKITDVRSIAQLTPSRFANKPSTDTNGWTVRDYGAWKEYTKVVAYSASIGNNAANDDLANSGNLPTGITLTDTTPVTVVAVGNGLNVSQHGPRFVPNSASPTDATSLSFGLRNVSGNTATFSGRATFRVVV